MRIIIIIIIIIVVVVVVVAVVVIMRLVECRSYLYHKVDGGLAKK